jgi:AcrR family transcriptional regulator
MSTAPRIPLSKERVLRAAIAFADEQGIEALSMRKLAKELGVEAMSLYKHVANKDEILAGVLDLVASEIELPDGPDWRTALRRNAISTRDVFVRHRWAGRLWMSQQSGGPERLRLANWMLKTLREAGFSGDLIYHAFHILEAHILGFTVMQLSFPYKGKELAGMTDMFLARIGDDYPDLVEHVKAHIEPPQGKGGFELGLDLLLDGFERSR